MTLAPWLLGPVRISQPNYPHIYQQKSIFVENHKDSSPPGLQGPGWHHCCLLENCCLPGLRTEGHGLMGNGMHPLCSPCIPESKAHRHVKLQRDPELPPHPAQRDTRGDKPPAVTAHHLPQTVQDSRGPCLAPLPPWDINPLQTTSGHLTWACCFSGGASAVSQARWCPPVACHSMAGQGPDSWDLSLDSDSES